MYLLFDCNNFFAGCEQVFRPDWRHRPLVVLSNNDGCVIARSAEAKAAGIAMGEPYFKCRERLERMNAVVCSGNFPLYTNISDRVMRILEAALPDVQQYSIDEAFSCVDDAHDWEPAGRELRRRIRRWTGVTVSVGIAPTRTLAKLANEHAKHHPECNGLVALPTAAQWQPLLEKTPVEDIWGVGRRLAPRLRGLGIRTAAALAQADLSLLNRHFGVTGERLALELRGTSCLDEQASVDRTQVMVTRSLKEGGVYDLATLRDVLCRFTEKAARTLREEGLKANALYVLLRTSRYEQEENLYLGGEGVRLEFPCDDTRELTRRACELLQELYREGYAYRKVGVLLAELIPAEAVHPTFDHPQTATDPLMHLLDSLHRAGHNVHFANHTGATPWRHDHSSRNYTGNWAELPELH